MALISDIKARVLKMADKTKRPDAGASFAESGEQVVGVLLDGGQVIEGVIDQNDTHIIGNVMAKLLGAFGDSLKAESEQPSAPPPPSLNAGP